MRSNIPRITPFVAAVAVLCWTAAASRVGTESEMEGAELWQPRAIGKRAARARDSSFMEGDSTPYSDRCSPPGRGRNEPGPLGLRCLRDRLIPWDP